jgi:hypothetical protein
VKKILRKLAKWIVFHGVDELQKGGGGPFRQRHRTMSVTLHHPTQVEPQKQVPPTPQGAPKNTVTYTEYRLRGCG